MVLRIKEYNEVRIIDQEHVTIGLYEKEGQYVIHRFAARGKINNFVANYEFIDNNNVSHLKPIDLE